MILVDIYVAALNEQYDFKVDENAYIAKVAAEIGGILAAEYPESEHGNRDNISDLLLCDFGRQRILPMNQTLKQNGIGNGSRLTLI